MDLEEAEGKRVLAGAGIAVPAGELCATPEAAAAAARRLGPCAVKAQVPAGKRGKAGGVRLADTPEAARAAAAAILGMDIAGHRVEKVLVEQRASIVAELYCAVVSDVASRGPLILFSAAGGMDIEQMQDKIVRVPVDIAKGLERSRLAGVESDVVDILARLYELYLKTDAELVEINPLARLKDGKLLALDCKLVMDDAALYRQPELAKRGASERLTALEQRGRELGLKYIELPGNIGVLANPRVKSLMVNFCGAFARTDVMAEGVIRAWETLKPTLPVFFSVHGTGEEEAIKLIRERLRLEPYDRMEDAVKAAVKAARKENP